MHRKCLTLSCINYYCRARGQKGPKVGPKHQDLKPASAASPGHTQSSCCQLAVSVYLLPVCSAAVPETTSKGSHSKSGSPIPTPGKDQHSGRRWPDPMPTAFTLTLPATGAWLPSSRLLFAQAVNKTEHRLFTVIDPHY